MEGDAEAIRLATPDVAPRSILEGGARVEVVEAVEANALSIFRAQGLLSNVSELARLRVVHGTVKTDQLAWYTVTYPGGAFAQPPTVLALVEHREGWFSDLTFTAPQLDLGQVANISGQKCSDIVTSRVNIPVIGAALGALAFWIGWVLGFIAGFFVNIALIVAAKQSEVALNRAPDLLYVASDRPRMKLTTAEVRNVGVASMEVMGFPKASIHLLIVGSRQGFL